MPKTIMLVLGNQGTEHTSIDLSIHWATKSDALLVGLVTVDERVSHPHEAVPLGAGAAKRDCDAARLARLQQDADATLSSLALRCAKEGVAFKPLEHVGLPITEILLEAQRYDLIVMPRDGHYFHAHTGSRMEMDLWKVLHAAPRPVIVVPDQATEQDAILVAYDGSVQAARALHAFVATDLGAGRAVHVVSLDHDRSVAALRGERAVDFLDHHGLQAVLHAETCDSHTDEALMRHAHRLHAGLIVMGAFGHSLVQECILGSVARSLLTRCAIPLFLYH